MMKEAEKFAAEDAQRREMAEARNLGDNLVYQTDKSLKEYGEKLTDGDKVQIEAGVTELKEALGTEDLERIKSATEKLNESSHKLAEQIYAQSNPTDGSATQGAAQSDDDVVDAEIVEESQV